VTAVAILQQLQIIVFSIKMPNVSPGNLTREEINSLAQWQSYLPQEQEIRVRIPTRQREVCGQITATVFTIVT
jgi:hypothetical protein